MPMTFPLPHDLWQSLRVLARAKTSAPGRELRVLPSRRTRDGAFLDRLVEAGLLAVAHRAPDGGPFDHLYALTPAGAVAAEYGEAEVNLACGRPAGARAS